MTGGLQRVASTLVLVVMSFLLTALILRVSGYQVGEVFSGVIQGALTATGASTSTIRWAIPLLLIGLGVVIGFRAGFFNIGGQGQFYMGACAALIVSLGWREGPALLVVLCGTVAAVAAGAVWSLIPGYLRVRFGTDEVLTTLMMSFIGALVLQYLTAGPLRNPSGTGQTAASERIPEALRITDGSGVSATVLVLVGGTAVLVWLLLERTRFGLAMTLVGRNPTMARWQGIDVRRVGPDRLRTVRGAGGPRRRGRALRPAGPAGHGILPRGRVHRRRGSPRRPAERLGHRGGSGLLRRPAVGHPVPANSH